jgi:hypothetical protein
MAASEDEIRENIRQTMIGLLRTLAHAEELREYSARLGGAVGEVYCQWFDDLYHPGDLLFQSAFSPETRQALAQVDAALTARKDLVEGRDIETILQAPWWQVVQSAAQRALRMAEG